jgi:DNA-binding NarL/FixJ family response regulator
MTMKRVILANHSRLVLEALHRALDKSEHLEVVNEVINNEDLPFAIQRFCPDWVIVCLPLSDSMLNWIGTFLQNDLSVRFVFFSDDYRKVTVKWQTVPEQDLSDLSLKQFIYILEKDLQQIG